MQDLISRQAAIDTVMECYDNDELFEEYEDRLNNLPSAQPMHWIPCSERLPKDRLYVLVTYKYEYGLIDHGITWYGRAEKKWDTSREVIAWMPLPEPWKGEEHETDRQ